ncbi:MAG: tetratricopeptide repeat protein [Bacteroidales bacterium]|nr:tetratricopeptide repeat protein [Bacteroidales bacterium]
MEPARFIRFWKELKRRKVFMGIIAYGASALVILEATEIICNAFGIERVPPWVVILLGIGFLVALVFSWIYDITPGGIKRTEPLEEPELPLVSKKIKTYRLTTFVSVILIIGLLSFNIIDNAKSRKFGRLEKTMAVLPFTDLLPPGYESLVFNYIGEEITACLSKIYTFKVLPWRVTSNYKKGNKSYNKIGKELKANLLIDWKAVEIDGNKRLTIFMFNTEDEKLLWSHDYPLEESWTEISIISPEISRSVARRLKTFLSQEERAMINEIPGSSRASFIAYKGSFIAQNALYLYELGNRKTELSVFDEAIDLYTQAIQIDPDFAAAYANRAKTRSWGIYTGYYDNSHLGKCRDDIEKATNLDPDLIEADIAMGFYCYYGLEDYKNALVYFERALEKQPDNVDCLFYLSLVYRRMGNWEKVASISAEALKRNPANALFYTNIGLSFDYLHDFEKAIECHNLAIESLPEWAASYQNKVESVLMLSGDTEKARAILEQNHNMTGYNIHYTLARLNMYDGNCESALKNINIAYPDDSATDGDSLLLKAQIYMHCGSRNKAMEYYQHAINYFTNEVKYGPENSGALSKLGLAYAGIGDKTNAIKYGMSATELMPVDKDAINGPNRLYDLARIYCMVGEEDLCIELIKKLATIGSLFSIHFVYLDPDFEKIRNNLNIIQLMKQVRN